MALSKGLFTSERNYWETPRALFADLDAEFSFTLDPCSTQKNAKCKTYFTEQQNGLLQSWQGHRVFCNPPYGKEIGKWCEKAYREVIGGNCPLVVLLLPARTDTKYFHNFIYGFAEIRFIKGRLKFEIDGVPGGPAPFPSMICILRGGGSDLR